MIGFWFMTPAGKQTVVFDRRTGREVLRSTGYQTVSQAGDRLVAVSPKGPVTIVDIGSGSSRSISPPEKHAVAGPAISPSEFLIGSRSDETSDVHRIHRLDLETATFTPLPGEYRMTFLGNDIRSLDRVPLRWDNAAGKLVPIFN